MEQRIRPNARCHRCPSPDTVRLRKIRRTDNHVFRCLRCGFLFSPPTPSTPSRRPEVEEPAPCPTRGHAPQLRRETREPKLDSYANAASETTPGYPRDVLQLRPEPGAAPRSAPNRPQNHAFQLGRKTTKSKLDSYADAAIETTSSYEKTIFSYDSGRILADRTAPTTPRSPRHR